MATIDPARAEEIRALSELADKGDLKAGVMLSRALLASGQVEQSFDRLVATAKAGSPIAGADLAIRLTLGFAAPRDPAMAQKWMLKAADAGFPEAARHLATMSAAGTVDPPDFPRAISILGELAQRGDPAAKMQLGIIVGAGINSDETLAAFLAPDPAPVVNDPPRILAAETLIPQVMTRWWMERAKPKLDRARVYNAETGERHSDPMRSNSVAGFGLFESDVVMQLTLARIAAAVGRPRAWQEPPNVLRYKPGEQYEPHYDYIDPSAEALKDDLAANGQRVTTALVYLSDDFTGGETGFDALNGAVRVPTGGLLAWDNVTPDGAPDPRTLHSGRPPQTGEKWVLSVWIRSQPQPPA
jgi:prolyl 4-hydroxylase